MTREDGSNKTYGCGGDDYCLAVYGAGSWGFVNGGERTDQNEYGCTGDDYCAARYGAGSWMITLGCSNGSRGLGWIYYGCGGDDYCHVRFSTDYGWGCYEAGKTSCGTSSDCGGGYVDNGCYVRNDYVPSP